MSDYETQVQCDELDAGSYGKLICELCGNVIEADDEVHKLMDYGVAHGNCLCDWNDNRGELVTTDSPS